MEADPNSQPQTVLKILVAEDNPDAARPVRRLIHRRLEPLLDGVGFEINIVATLREALELSADASATVLDLTLLDAGPDEVIAAIRRFRKPVIVMTGETDPSFHARCMMNGADHVFVKARGQQEPFLQAILHCLTRDVLSTCGDPQ